MFPLAIVKKERISSVLYNIQNQHFDQKEFKSSFEQDANFFCKADLIITDNIYVGELWIGFETGC